MKAIELFAGPGGWSEGFRLAQTGSNDEMLGVEFDPDACATATKAGHRRLCIDVTMLSPQGVSESLGGCDYIHASPPCQGFSIAGHGKGRADGDELLATIYRLRDLPHRAEEYIREFSRNANDSRSALTLEPLRWISELSPEFVTLEQVPTVLPIWQAYAATLEKWGYSVWTGILHSEQYGVPQSRKRAILMARKGEHTITPPAPKYSRYNPRYPQKLDQGLPRWVTISDVLGEHLEGVSAMQSNYSGPGAPGATASERGLGERSLDLPSFSLTGKPPRWMASGTRPNSSIRSFDEPSVTLAFGHDSGSFVFGEGDGVTPADLPEMKAKKRVKRISPTEAGILQSFQYDYPWQGNLTSQYSQIGNCVPPLLAQAIVESLIKE